MTVPITATIITKNEIKHIEACITAAFRVADEVLVVDSFSTDGTQELSRKLGARVVEHPFEGYAAQKNVALEFATFDHILSLDADEVLSEELIQSIIQVKSNFTAAAYQVNRFNNYCGHWIHYSGWYPDRKTRLFDRRAARWGGGNVHEKVMLGKNASIERLSGDLLHYTYESIHDHLQRINRYTDMMAKKSFDRGKKAPLYKIIFSPIINFIKRYIFKSGFRDGYYGWIIAVMGAYYSFLKYVKLRELWKKK